jgi:hypothetical protein
MNMKKDQINEMMLRRAIMQRTDISAANKLVLLAILLKVDWSTWAGPATVGELAKLSGISERSVQTTLKKLDDHLISRSWMSFKSRSLPTITLKINAIMRGAVFSETKNIQGEKYSFRGADLADRGEKYSSNGEKSAPLQPNTTYNNHNTTINTRENVEKNDQDLEVSHSVFSHSDDVATWGQISDSIQADELAKKASHPKLKQLSLEQQRIINQHVRFSGHPERVRVARKLLNIKLMKGGYYEQI